MRSATQSRQEARPGAAGQAWNNPCHACSTQFGDVHGRKGGRAARLSGCHSHRPTQQSWTRGRDASSVMSPIHSPDPAVRSSRARLSKRRSTPPSGRHHSKWATEVAESGRRHRPDPAPRILPGFKTAPSGGLFGTSRFLIACGVANINTRGSRQRTYRIFCTQCISAFLERAWPSSRPQQLRRRLTGCESHKIGAGHGGNRCCGAMHSRFDVEPRFGGLIPMAVTMLLECCFLFLV